MMTVYGYGFSEPQPVVAPQPTTPTWLWAALAALGGWWWWKRKQKQGGGTSA